jgi:hypothetical protein
MRHLFFLLHILSLNDMFRPYTDLIRYMWVMVNCFPIYPILCHTYILDVIWNCFQKEKFIKIHPLKFCCAAFCATAWMLRMLLAVCILVHAESIFACYVCCGGLSSYNSLLGCPCVRNCNINATRCLCTTIFRSTYRINTPHNYIDLSWNEERQLMNFLKQMAFKSNSSLTKLRVWFGC